MEDNQDLGTCPKRKEKMKSWIVKYFRGGYLAKSHLMDRQEARDFMQNHIDGYCMEKVEGFNRGRMFYKYEQEKAK